MSIDKEEFRQWGELGEKEQLDWVLTILKGLPKMDQIKLVVYLTRKAPQLAETKFFVEFAGIHHDLVI